MQLLATFSCCDYICETQLPASIFVKEKTFLHVIELNVLLLNIYFCFQKF